MLVPVVIAAFLLSSSTRTETKYLCVSDAPDMTVLRAKASGGDAEAEYRMGMLNFGPDGEWHEAAYWLQKAAEQGHARAEFWLGTMYERGHALAQDSAEAAQWYLRAAQQGNADAQVSLGQLYEEGDGVQQDDVQAAYWYGKAAEQVPDLGGVGQGRWRLGKLYYQGRGVKQNYVQAYKWFALAMMSGEMDRAAKHMTKHQIRTAQHLAKRWIDAHPAHSSPCGV
jgi:TPR repeat protein